MDAISLLKADHRRVESLFEQYESLGSRAKKGKVHAVEQIITELTLHAQIEEQIFYPRLKAAMEAADMVCEALEEHDVVKYVLRQLASGDPADEMFKARVTVLKELVQHHVDEEEKEMFATARRLLDGAALLDLGEQMVSLKQQLMARSPKVTITMVNEAPAKARHPAH